LKIFNKDIDIIITGNKSDLGINNLDNESINKYCENLKINKFYTSAKTGDGLEEMFENIFNRLAKRYCTEGKIKKRGLTISNSNKNNNSNNQKECC
jgi:hypothetical protein